MDFALRETQTRFYALDLKNLADQFSVDDSFNLLRLNLKDADADGSLKFIVSTYDPYDQVIRDGYYPGGRKILSFVNVLQHEVFPLADTLDQILHVGQDEMGRPIEIEFAVNIDPQNLGFATFYLLQVRPIVDNKEVMEEDLTLVEQEDTILTSTSVLGHGIVTDVQDIIYVKTGAFCSSNNQSIAYDIEKMNRQFTGEEKNYVLVGPGRWAQLVGKLDNLAWLLNLRAMDIECTPYAMAYCYVTPDRAVLFIHTARVTPEAKAELEANGVTLAEYDRVLDFMAAETEPQTVLAESATVNYAVYQVLENNAALTVKDLADPLLPMKGVKNEVELTHDKEAHLRDAVAMVRFQIELEKRLEAGEELTELTVDEILHKYRSTTDKFIVESFGTIAAYGGNAAMMHYHATPEDHAKLQRKGFLLVDSGATYMDGTTDITRTYPLGELTEDERKFYTWTLQCHIDIAKAVWLDYCDCHMIDTIAREPLWQHLINYRCGTGHSVSFVGNVHEGPHALNGRNTTLMRPGMIVTDEPGVYETDLVGIRIENELVCVHKADNQYGTFLGFEPIMFVPIATSPIVPGVLTKDELDWLNNYHRQVFEKLAPRLNDEEREWLAKKCAAIGC